MYFTFILMISSAFFCSYTWRTTEWSDCSIDSLLSQQDTRRSRRNVTGLCGGGLQTRDVYCVQTNAELLNYFSEFREKDKGKILFKSLQTCYCKTQRHSQRSAHSFYGVYIWI